MVWVLSLFILDQEENKELANLKNLLFFLVSAIMLTIFLEIRAIDDLTYNI